MLKRTTKYRVMNGRKTYETGKIVLSFGRELTAFGLVYLEIVSLWENESAN